MIKYEFKLLISSWKIERRNQYKFSFIDRKTAHFCSKLIPLVIQKKVLLASIKSIL